MTGKNAEGYPDPTASIAVSLVTKKEKEKEKMKDTANPEEIWMIKLLVQWEYHVARLGNQEDR